jgi:hypothetical protein
LHPEVIEAKAFRTFIKVHSLFINKRLRDYIKWAFHIAFIRIIMTYAYPAWEFAVNNHPIKLQSLQNKVLHTIGNFSKCTPAGDLKTALKIPYI